MYHYKETMDKLLAKELEEKKIIGANVLVLHKGEEIYHNVLGYANREEKIDMKRDTIFRMFSMTKPVTAAATMILAERGELDLWDPVSKYLPEYANQMVCKEDGSQEAAERDVTIWDLLNMTSGITYPDESHEPGRQMRKVFSELIKRREDGECITTREYVRRIAEVPLVFQPGERWMYGLSADLLGGIIEVISGKTYGAFLKEELFDPLGMKDTGFFVPKEKQHRFAQIYRWLENGEIIVKEGSHLGEYYNEDVAFESGGAGLVSTIDDYSQFAKMMLNKGMHKGKRILGRKTVEFMTEDRLTEKQKKNFDWDSIRGYGYSCLMRVMVDPGKAGSNASKGEYGWDGWTGNYVIISPEDDLIIMYFIQRCDAGVTPLVRKLRMVTYGALE
ncbi:beta-lactamase family protein [Lachnospiraceae bacterium OttesenSCG-928-D06]|nr:beta-lactamase family protein [Lachnospiraceae bacterium OttesenSCG-928-D06]